MSLARVIHWSLILIAVGGSGSAAAGDPFNARHFASDALNFEMVYTGEVFSNTRGGISTNEATRYLGLLDLGLTLDFERTRLPIPGKFHILAQNTHGEGLTEDFVGDAQVISNIDAFKNIMQVNEYWWEFELFDGSVTVRLGKQDLNTEFLLVETATDFIQSTFGLSPSTAFPTYPDPSMGGLVLLQLNEEWMLKLGLWDAFAPGNSWGFSGNDATVLISELEYRHTLFGSAFPGIMAVAFVYESSGKIAGERVSDVHEYAVQIEQVVYRENVNDCSDEQGMAAFAGYYPRFVGSEKIEDSIGDSFIAGVTYTGLLAGRDEDVVGTGIAWAKLFQGSTNEETVWETFYKAQLNPHLSIQPDLQYIATPSGIYSDSLAVGLRFQLTR